MLAVNAVRTNPRDGGQCTVLRGVVKVGDVLNVLQLTVRFDHVEIR